MFIMFIRNFLCSVTILLGILLSNQVMAKKYDTGASDTEIKIGNTSPYSGPASIYGEYGRTYAAYFAYINDKGGINGRKIKFISLDDSYNPARTVEQVRKLVEDDQVLLVFSANGTAVIKAVEPYLNSHKIPQLFVGSGAKFFADPEHYPWTTPGRPDYTGEAKAYIDYVNKNFPNAKIGVLYQNDDYGKTFLNAFIEELGKDAGKRIVSTQPYDATNPSIEAQIINLKNSGATVLLNVSTPKFAIQSIKKISELNWHPEHFMTLVASSRDSVFIPAGLENAKGIITAAITKDPTDTQWEKDSAILAYKEVMKKYNPSANTGDIFNVLAFVLAEQMVGILQKCGDDLTRENIRKVATNWHQSSDLLLPGIEFDITPKDYRLVKKVYLAKFNGKTWEQLGQPIELKK